MAYGELCQADLYGADGTVGMFASGVLFRETTSVRYHRVGCVAELGS